jgi:hypothetical protein
LGGHDANTSPAPLALTYDATTKTFSGVVNLRAEGAGDQSTRVYSVICHESDEAGNATIASCVVLVPHDRRRK